MTVPGTTFTPARNQYAFDENEVDRNVLEGTARFVIDSSVRGTFPMPLFLRAMQVKQLFFNIFLEAAYNCRGELGDERIGHVLRQLTEYAAEKRLVLQLNPYNGQEGRYPVVTNNNHNQRLYNPEE